MTAPGFAVVDVETTGFAANGDDRIIEIAVVHVDFAGTVTGAWSTVVDAGRATGTFAAHGLLESDFVGAPTFGVIVPDLVDLFAGRTVVAHNAAFTVGFLDAELARAGYPNGVEQASLCTMRLARDFAPGAGRSLVDCCDAYDIVVPDEHSSLVEAEATAALLHAYLAQEPHWPGWQGRLVSAFQSSGASLASWRPRSSSRGAPTFLARITIKLPEFSGPAEQLDYLAMLDRFLLDRDISAFEADALVGLAEHHGISRTTVAELHVQYFEELATVAWADGVLTTDEKGDLIAVASLLGIPAALVTEAMSPFSVTAVGDGPLTAGSFRLESGDQVSLSGDLSRPREEWRNALAERGISLGWSVNRRTKVLIASDPGGAAGKVRKAQALGIPIIDERALLRLVTA